MTIQFSGWKSTGGLNCSVVYSQSLDRLRPQKKASLIRVKITL